ncbi:unnamed protein product [Arabis nemorensis]|uniref:Uncharacterized protein n=1 Tax=Arabis nemorensis TaxID=586526 RepID=A0A565BLZ7_9BRAS|nr:unnamed protein product [Arabis nemorensis]
MKDAIKAGNAMTWRPDPKQTVSDNEPLSKVDNPFSFGSTEKGFGFYDAGPSGIKGKGGNPRKRPYKRRHKQIPRDFRVVVTTEVGNA